MRVFLGSIIVAVFLFGHSAFALGGECPNLTRNLSKGSRGADVRALQLFLISQGDLASGHDTGYFGNLTVAAVQSFQRRNNIVSSGTPLTTGYGAVGPRTRAAILGMCKGTSTSTATSTVSTSESESTSSRCAAFTVPQPTTLCPNRGPWEALVDTKGCQYGWKCGTVAREAPSRASCNVGGTTLASGDTGYFYSQNTAQSPITCISYMQSRTCTNGSLSGSSEFQYSSCTSIPAPASQNVTSSGTTTVTLAINGKTLDTVNVGSTYTIAWNSTNASSCSYTYTSSGVSSGPTSVPANAPGSMTGTMTNDEVSFTLTCSGAPAQLVSKTVNAVPHVPS